MSTIMEEYRERLFQALLGNIEVIPEGTTTRELLENIALIDLKAIEPIIEEMLVEAVIRSRKPN